MPEFTPGDWMIGRGNVLVAKPPDGCQCKECTEIKEYADRSESAYYGGHFLCESVQNGADAQLMAQAKRFYFAALKMRANVAAIVRKDAPGDVVEAFVDAWSDMDAAIVDADKPAVGMPDLPRPVRPAYVVK